MTIKALCVAALVAAITFAGSAHATPWTLTTQGTITSGWDYTGYFGDPGQQLNGLKYTQTITAETDPAVYQGWGEDSGHKFLPNWSEVYGYVYGGKQPLAFSTVITVNGKTLNLPITNVLIGVQSISSGATNHDPNVPGDSLDSDVQGYTASGLFVYSEINIGSDDPGAFAIPAPDFGLQLAGLVPADGHQQANSFVLNDPLGDSMVVFDGTPDSFSLNGGTIPTDVPEPASLALLGLGLAGLGVMRRRPC